MDIAKPPQKADPGSSAEFYAETNKIQPRAVKGRFRSYKWWSMAVLLAFWHIAPFLRWDRGPGAPSQAILGDLAGRRGYFFFIEIWPQEVYYITGMLLFAAIALFLMSALAGRIWCGFLCWQTVYTDLFVAVERMILGDRNKRIAFDRKSFAERFPKKMAVHLLWMVLALECGVSFTLFFDDAFTVLHELVTFTASAGTYSAIAIVGGCCYLLAGFGREQVCIYACPYSRFQSAMCDEHSLIISYEAWRGEPREPLRRDRTFDGRGHCIDCRMCIQVCPTGIDIREGSQLACIGCGLCIDACNGIMDKFKLPRGLIRYDSVNNMEARAAGVEPELKLIRPRTIVYAAILVVVGVAMLAGLAMRSTVEVNILHERSPTYVQLRDGSIRNGYTYKILNMIRQDRTFTVAVSGIEGATMEVVGEELKGTATDLTVSGDTVGTFRLYVTVPMSSIASKSTPLHLTLTDKAGGGVVRSSTVFMAPDQ